MREQRKTHGPLRARLFKALLSVSFAAVPLCLAAFCRRAGEFALDAPRSVNREMVSIASHVFWQSELFFYRQAMQHAQLDLALVPAMDDAALLRRVAASYAALQPLGSAVLGIVRSGEVTCALDGASRAVDPDALTRELAAAQFEVGYGMDDLTQVLLDPNVTAYNAQIEGTPVLLAVPVEAGASLLMFMKAARAQGMIEPLNQLADDMHAASQRQIGAVMRGDAR